MDNIFEILPLSSTRNSKGLCVAEHAVVDLADQYGTPLYLYDGETIKKQISRLQTLMERYGGGYEITYAAKAYYSLGMARHLRETGVSIDVVSLGELEISHLAGFDPDCIHLHGNNKTEEELQRALDLGIHSIVADSLAELQLIEELAQSKGRPADIWIRVTPGVEIDVHPYVQTAKLASKFGLGIVGGIAAEGIRYAQKSNWLNLTGLHIHLGSQIFTPRPYAEGIILLAQLAEEVGFIPAELSPGGGWGVPYTTLDSHVDPSLWTDAVINTVQEEFGKRNWPLPKLYLEPGRWIVAQAGLAVYRVGTTKYSSDGRYFVAVDGGIADNIRPPLYHARYSAIIADRPDAIPSYRSAVVGKYCESGDELISDIILPEVKRGDLLVIPVAGAYQLSMASNYNMSCRPAVLWLERNRVDTLQKRERPYISGWFVDE